MSRLDIITIGIVTILLAALGFLVYKIVTIMDTPEEAPAVIDSYTDQDEIADDTYNTSDWDDDDVNEADLDDDELTYSTTDDELTRDADDEAYESDSDAETYEPSPATTSSTSSRSTYTAGEGRFMVIAGSYQQKANADNQVSKLRRMGYDDTRVELFDRGSYAVVLVDRFSQLSEAKQLVRKLASDGVEAFVKEKR